MHFGSNTQRRIFLRTLPLPLLCVILFQSPSSNADKKFKWDWRNAQELRADQSLSSARLSDTEKHALTSAIAGRLRPMMSDLEIPTEEDLQKATLNTRIKLVQLGGEDQQGVIAQAMVDCGATGNCPLWVLMKVGNIYKLLLEAYAQTFTIQPSRTNGFFDVVAGMHGSASETSLTDYRYRGGAYFEEGCYIARWEVVENGEQRQLPEPRLDPCRK